MFPSTQTFESGGGRWVLGEGIGSLLRRGPLEAKYRKPSNAPLMANGSVAKSHHEDVISCWLPANHPAPLSLLDLLTVE